MGVGSFFLSPGRACQCGASVPSCAWRTWLQARPLGIHSCTTYQNQHKPGVMGFAVDFQVGLQQPVRPALRHPSVSANGDIFKEGRVRWFPSF